MNKRLIVILVVGVVVLGGAYLFAQQKKNAKAEELRQQAVTKVEGVDICRGTVNAQNLVYVKGLVEKSHPAGARALGGLFNAMIKQAKADGREDIATSLRNFAVGRGYLDVGK
jgi:hypothetical protein